MDESPKPHRTLLKIWSIMIVVPLCLSLLNFLQQHYPALTSTKPAPGLAGVIEVGILEGDTSRFYDITPRTGTISLAAIHVPAGDSIPGSPLALI